MGLSAQEMDQLGDVVNAAVLTAISSSAEVLRPKLLEFSISLVLREIPYQLFSGQLEGTKRLADLMYNDATTRDFILTVTMHIFAKFGNTQERYADLVDNLAQAIGFISSPTPRDRKDAETAPAIIVPDELQDRLPTIEDVREILLYNRWATTLALMILYLMPPDDLNYIWQEYQVRKTKVVKKQTPTNFNTPS